MKYTIIADSSCDLYDGDFSCKTFDFVTVPINISVDAVDYRDGLGLDTGLLIKAAKASKSPVKTACPPPELFLEQMRGRDNIIILTLSSKLSGTYLSACHAANEMLKQDPSKNIFVLDSLLTSAGMSVILLRLKEMIEGGLHLSFKDLTNALENYAKTVKIRFVLCDYSNLVKSGRMGRIASLIASTLVIKPICGDNGQGEIKLHAKCFGAKKSLKTLCALAGERLSLSPSAPVVIAHCHNEDDAVYLSNLIKEKYANANIKIYPMRGTASVYAGDKGLAIAF